MSDSTPYSSPTSQGLPLELIQHILSHFSQIEDDRERIRTLLKCSLVSRVFKEVSRDLVFSKISINKKYWEWEDSATFKVEWEEGEEGEVGVEGEEAIDIDYSQYHFEYCAIPEPADEYDTSESSAMALPPTGAFPASLHFVDLIQTIPSIIPLIHTLEYHADYARDTGDILVKLTDAFVQLTHVRSLMIDLMNMGSSVPLTDCKRGVDHLFALPSLTHLQLRATFFPTAFIANCTNLLSLHLQVEYNVMSGSASNAASEQRVLPRPTVLRSRGMGVDHWHLGDAASTMPLPSLHPHIVDYSRLHTVTYDKLQKEDFISLMAALEGCQNLHTVGLAYKDTVMSWSWVGLEKLLSNPSLRNLTLRSPWPGIWGVSGTFHSHRLILRDVFHDLLDVLGTVRDVRLETLSLTFTLHCVYVTHMLSSSWRAGSTCQWSRLAGSEILASWRRLGKLFLGLDVHRGTALGGCCLITKEMMQELRRSTLSHFSTGDKVYDVACLVEDATQRYISPYLGEP